MFGWQQIIVGVVSGAILGIAGAFFAFQKRRAFLEEKVSSHQFLHHHGGDFRRDRVKTQKPP